MGNFLLPIQQADLVHCIDQRGQAAVNAEDGAGGGGRVDGEKSGLMVGGGRAAEGGGGGVGGEGGQRSFTRWGGEWITIRGRGDVAIATAVL